MPKTSEPTLHRDDMDSQDSDTTVDEASAPSPGAALAAHVAGLELDNGTLELVMAALTADVCDHIEALRT